MEKYVNSRHCRRNRLGKNTFSRAGCFLYGKRTLSSAEKRLFDAERVLCK
jgi:hypothetical protein